jgi:hypothetical protein
MNVIRKYFVQTLLVSCALLLAFWQIMSWVSRREYEPFELTPEKLVAFQPALEGWTTCALPIARDVVDANIAAFSLVLPQ